VTPPAGPPNSYRVEIPQGWELIGPKSQFVTSIQYEMADAAGVPTPPQSRIPTEKMSLEKLPRGTDGKGIALRARYGQVVSGTTLKAETGVGFYSIETSNDPGTILQALKEHGEDAVLVEMPAGTAVLRTYEHKGSVFRQYLVPVPNTASDVALLSYSTSTPERRDELLELFNLMAQGFGFDWESGEDMPEVQEWIQGMANESGTAVTYVTDSGEERTVMPGPGSQRAKPGFSFQMQGSPFAGQTTGIGLPPQQSRAVGVLLLLFLLVISFAPGITLFAKAPILVLGALLSLGVARRQADKGWAVVGYVGAVLGGIVFLALTLYGGRS